MVLRVVDVIFIAGRGPLLDQEMVEFIVRRARRTR
jgi:hypothetical protein